MYEQNILKLVKTFCITKTLMPKGSLCVNFNNLKSI